MKRLFLLASSLLLLASPASAQSIQLISPGDLIKASGPSVYYYGQDGKRYVFPNEKTYMTWYSGYGSVKTVQDLTLASFAIGGIVTNRPGVKLVKITTDPKTYAVAANGTLRWVMTESVARELYGTDWNLQVNDIPDAFFTNYHVGTPIMSATDFAPSTETANAPTIGEDKRIGMTPTPIPPPTPTPTSTPPIPPNSKSGTLVPSKTQASENELVTIIATGMPNSGIWYVNLYFDGFLSRTCEYSPCGTDVRMPTGKTTVDAHADFIWTDGGRASVTSTIGLTAGSPGTNVTVRSEVEPNSLREIIVDVDASFSANTIDIYMDGGAIRGCNAVQQCRYTGYESSPVGTVHTTYGVIHDANGYTRQTAVKQFTVVTNDRPVVSIITGKTDMNVGEMVDATVNASDDDGVAWTEVSTDDGLSTKRCNSTVCTLSVTRTAAGSFRFIGHSSDALGAIGSVTSSVVTVH